MNKKTTLKELKELANHYKEIIAISTDKYHVKATKEALRIVNSKIKNYATK